MAEQEVKDPKISTPKYMLYLDGMGFTSTVKGFESYTELLEWGLDAYCHAVPQSSGSYQQQEPPTTSPLYVRLYLGLHLPKLLKAMITKKSIKDGHVVMLASINNTNNVVMELNLGNITVEEVLLGNNIRGKNTKNLKGADNNKDNSFEMILRFGKIEWNYVSYKQDGGKEGKDAAVLNIQTGEAS